MFGIFYALASLVGYTASGVKHAADNSYYKGKAIEKRNKGENLANLYTDADGRTRDINTNQPRHLFPDLKTGEVWLEDQYGNKIRNISQEKRNLEFEQKRRDSFGVKAIKYDNWSRKNSKKKFDDWKCIMGDIYKDVNTGALYVERRLRWDTVTLDRFNGGSGLTGRSATFYMDIDNGHLVGVSDSHKNDKFNQRARIRYKSYTQKDDEYINIEDLPPSDQLHTLLDRYGVQWVSIPPLKDEIDTFIKKFNEIQDQGGTGWYDYKFGKTRNNEDEWYNQGAMQKEKFYLCDLAFRTS